MKWQLLRLVSLLAIIGGLALSAYSYNFKKNFEAATRWPTTEGKILSYDDNSKIIHGSDRYGNPTTDVIYRPEVLYEYEVNKKKYKNSRILYIDREVVDSVTMTDISAVLPSFKTKFDDVKLKVYYNPEKPEESLLVPIFNPVTLGVGIYGSLGFAFCAFIFLLMVNASIPKN